MPEFCAVCSHDRRDHFDNRGCTVQVSRLITRVVARLRRSVWAWVPCPCNTYVPEEGS